MTYTKSRQYFEVFVGEHHLEMKEQGKLNPDREFPFRSSADPIWFLGFSS